MKITSENSNDFLTKCLSWGCIIGGNELRYMIVTINSEVIGTQRCKYPTEWFNEVLKDKNDFKNTYIYGAYVVYNKNTSNSFEYINEDYPDYINDYHANYGNLNGLSCKIQDRLKAKYDNFAAIIFFNDSSNLVKNRLLIVLYSK